MITGVVLSGSALRDLNPNQGSPSAGLDSVQAVLRDILVHHGVLVGTVEEWTRLGAVVKNLEDSERKAWGDLLVYLESRGRVLVVPSPEPPACIDTASSAADLVDVIPRYGQGHLAVVPTAKDGEYGLSVRAPTTDAGPHEVVRSVSVLRARRFTELSALVHQQHHPQGCSRDKLFDDVLRGPARYSTEVVIADRYLFANLRRRARRHCGEPEAVGWLLEQFGRWCLPGARVTLVGGVSEDGQPASLDEAASLVDAAWRRGEASVREVEVRGTNWRDYFGNERLQHDRHIAFGCELAVKVSGGVDMLSEPSLWDVQGTWWSFVSDATAVSLLRDSEARIFEASGRASRVLAF